MRLRWMLVFAFVALAALQLAVVAPLAMRSLSRLLAQQQEARVDQLMITAQAEAQRLRDDVQHAMDELAQSQALEDVARDAAKTPTPAHVTAAAEKLMTPRGLDVLALLDDAGRTLSSGHLPARIGEPDDPLFPVTRRTGVTSARVELSSDRGLISSPAIVTARAIDYGERRVWAVGGILLSQARADALAHLTGARVELLSNGAVIVTSGEAPPPVITRTLAASDDATVRLSFSQADLVATRTEVLRAFLTFALVGLLLSVLVGFLLSRRLTRPVEALTEAAEKIAAGTPGVTVEERGGAKELRALVATFNTMTGELKTATDKLLASERIAAWQEVARRLAHEIKNPLTPIRMSLETLLAASQRGPLDEHFTQLLGASAKAMLEEVTRLTRIVDEFSQFARLPRPELKALQLDELVRQLMTLYAPHDGLTFDTQLAPATANADRDQLTQVLVNLVKNAEEAMVGRTGRISVRVTAGEELRVEVEDEGPGIPPELKDRLFEPYVTTKEHGTGLGLAIARRIIEEHHGRLELHEGSSGGALFRVVLPRASLR